MKFKNHFFVLLSLLIAAPSFAGTYVINDFTVNDGADLICGWDDSALNGECFAIGNGLQTSALNFSVKTQMSVTADSSGVKLDGDQSTPGNSKYYGTNGSGTRGWYATLPPTAPAGTDKQLQFNNAGSFGGAKIEYTDDLVNTLTLAAESGKALNITSDVGFALSSINGPNSSLIVSQPIGISLFSTGSVVLDAGTALALTGDTWNAASGDFTYQYQSGFGIFGTLDFSNATTDRAYVFQDGDGTLAFLSDIPAVDPAISSIAGVSWVQGDLIYWSGTDTAARLAKNTTATRYLSNTGTSNNPAWAQVDVSNGITGQVPVANGGCNANNESDCLFNLSTPLPDAEAGSVSLLDDGFSMIGFSTAAGNYYQFTGSYLASQFSDALSTIYQPLDSDLTSLAGNTTNGFWARTGSGAGAARTLTAPAAGLTISNPAGTAGNPTFALANDLAALEGLASTGYAVRTGTDTWAQRTFTAGKGLTIANGSGVSGATNYLVDLASTKMDWTGDHTFIDGMLRLIETGGGTDYFAFKMPAITGVKNINLPALTADDTFVFLAQAQTLTNKTLTAPVLDTSISGTAFLDEDDFSSNSAVMVASQQSIKAYVDARADYKSPITGRFYPPEAVAHFPGTAGVLNDWTYFIPFKRDGPFTLDKLYIEVTTAAGGSNIRLCLYTDVNGVPTSLISTSGTVSSASTGIKSLTGIAQSIQAGRFWVAFQTDAIIAVRSFNGTVLGNEYNSQIGVGAFNNMMVLSTDLTSTYAGGCPATPAITQLNGIDTPMIYMGI